ncbi:MAG: chromosomal replication initiator protein DnaA [Synergistaceae bacterium]|nr:chromosomal replication initiator protein DnaA [Synergistaceae bacterium]
MVQKDLQTLWQSIIDRATSRLPEGTADLWFTTCSPTDVEDDVLVVDVANVFVKERIGTLYLSELNRAAKELGEVSSIRLETSTEPEDEEKRAGWEKRAEKAVGKPNPSNTTLNPNYVFSSFVVGKSNRLAHAASLAVAESPGEAYNPLFIWGGVGLGKTHLMHAICHHALEKKHNLSVVYLSTEKFVNEFIQSLQLRQGHEFKHRYRNVDILLMDDIQFLAGKNSSQEEFFHTFEALRGANRQIVICSDHPPTGMRDIEDRLLSRFAWGLVTDIQPPDIETRIAILRKKAALRECSIPDEVIDFLARRIPSNIRELEGALNRLIACSELNAEPVSIDSASTWLKDILKSDLKNPATLADIQAMAAEAFGMTVEDLTGNKRTAEIAMARQVAMYLCREHTDSSLNQVAQAFRKKDHTTVIHAQRKISQLLRDDEKLRNIVDSIRSKL